MVRHDILLPPYDTALFANPIEDHEISGVPGALDKGVDKVDESWIDRCRSQQDGALAALEKCCVSGALTGPRLMQPKITVACMLGYVRLRQPAALRAGHYPALEALSRHAEADPAFIACRPRLPEIGGTTEEASLALLRLLGDQQSR